jgi:hypothetical protein
MKVREMEVRKAVSVELLGWTTFKLVMERSASFLV